MRLTTLSTVFAALALSACVSASDGPAARPLIGLAATMPMGPTVAAPKGYVAMCRDQPQLCVEASPTSIAALSSDAQLALLQRVNLRVNARVRQMTDVQAFGVQGLWTRAGGGDFGAAGDCKAIAVEKRVELEAAGVPASALFYAIAYRNDIGLHAVLVAHTDQGDMVLDSRSPRIVPWSQAPYTWVQRQSQGEAFAWAMVIRPAGAAAALVLASAD